MKMYSDKYFAEQLKKALLYRDIKKQTLLSNILGISKQIISLWKLKKRIPNCIQLIKIANILKIQIDYFFTYNAIPENYSNGELSKKTKLMIKNYSRKKLIPSYIKEIVILSWDTEKKQLYTEYCNTFDIKYYTAQSINEMRQILYNHNPECLYLDKNFPIEIGIINIKKILI